MATWAVATGNTRTSTVAGNFVLPASLYTYTEPAAGIYPAWTKYTSVGNTGFVGVWDLGGTGDSSNFAVQGTIASEAFHAVYLAYSYWSGGPLLGTEYDVWVGIGGGTALHGAGPPGSSDWRYNYTGPVTTITMYSTFGIPSSTSYASDNPGDSPTWANLSSSGVSASSKGGVDGTYSFTTTMEEWVIFNDATDGLQATYVETPSGSTTFALVCGAATVSATWDITPTSASILSGQYIYANSIPDLVRLTMGMVTIDAASMTCSVDGVPVQIPEVIFNAQNVSSISGPSSTFITLPSHIQIATGGMLLETGWNSSAPYIPSTETSGGITCFNIAQLDYSPPLKFNPQCFRMALDSPITGQLQINFEDSGGKSYNQTQVDTFIIDCVPGGAQTEYIQRQMFNIGCVGYIASYGDYDYAGNAFASPVNGQYRWDTVQYTVGPVSTDTTAYNTYGYTHFPSYDALTIGSLPNASIGPDSMTYLDYPSTASVTWTCNQAAEGFRYLKVPLSTSAAGISVLFAIKEKCPAAVNITDQTKYYSLTTADTETDTLYIDLCAPLNGTAQNTNNSLDPCLQQSRYPTLAGGDTPFFSETFWGVNYIESITMTITEGSATIGFCELESDTWKVDCSPFSVYDTAYWIDGNTVIQQNSLLKRQFVVRGNMRYGFEGIAVGYGLAIQTVTNVVSDATGRGYTAAAVSTTDTSAWHYNDQAQYINCCWWDDYTTTPTSQINIGASSVLKGQMISYQTSGYYGMNWYPLITYTSGIAAEGIIYNVNRQPNSEIAVNFAPGGPAATSGGDGSYIETEPYSTYSAIPGEISVSSLGYRTLSSPVNSGLLLRMILAFKPGGVWARHDSHGQYHESYLPGDGSVTHNRSDTGAFSTLYAYSIFTGLISQASFHSSRRTDGHPLCYTYVTGYQGFYGFSHDDGQSVFTGTLFTGTDKVSHTNSIELATHDGTLLVWTSYITGSSGDVNIKISRLNPDTTVDGVYIIGGLSPIQFLDGQFGLTVDPLTGNPFISAIKSGDTSPTRYVSYDDGESWTDLTTTMPTSPNIGFYQEIPSGTVNGTNVTFGPLTHTPLTNSLVLLRNAEVLALGTDYTLSGATITMITAPTTTGGLTDRLYATYAYAV